jgi:hypothetical protein
MRFADIASLPAIAFTALIGLSSAATAGPIWVYSTSTGTQPSNVGVITLTQDGADAVDVDVDLINSTYGFLNSGGPHTPFAFNLFGGTSGLGITFTTPPGGIYSKGTFTLDTAGGSNTPYGTFGVAIDDSAGTGSSQAYYGDLLFTLTRTGGLSTNDFIANAGGYFFSADITDGGNTGAQAWSVGIDPPAAVPEPVTMSLFGAGLAGMAAMRRRKTKMAKQA